LRNTDVQSIIVDRRKQELHRLFEEAHRVIQDTQDKLVGNKDGSKSKKRDEEPSGYGRPATTPRSSHSDS